MTLAAGPDHGDGAEGDQHEADQEADHHHGQRRLGGLGGAGGEAAGRGWRRAR